MSPRRLVPRSRSCLAVARPSRLQANARSSRLARDVTLVRMHTPCWSAGRCTSPGPACLLTSPDAPSVSGMGTRPNACLEAPRRLGHAACCSLLVLLSLARFLSPSYARDAVPSRILADARQTRPTRLRSPLTGVPVQDARSCRPSHHGATLARVHRHPQHAVTRSPGLVQLCRVRLARREGRSGTRRRESVDASLSLASIR